MDVWQNPENTSRQPLDNDLLMDVPGTEAQTPSGLLPGILYGVPVGVLYGVPGTVWISKRPQRGKDGLFLRFDIGCIGVKMNGAVPTRGVSIGGRLVQPAETLLQVLILHVSEEQEKEQAWLHRAQQLPEFAEPVHGMLIVRPERYRPVHAAGPRQQECELAPADGTVIQQGSQMDTGDGPTYGPVSYTHLRAHET